MTKFQALFVKYLRVRCDGSWRWVAGKWNMRYNLHLPFTMESTYGGNQIDGMELCYKSQEILNERTIEDGWN